MKFLPNALSVLRILLAPLTCWLIWTGSFQNASLVILAAAVTDGLDGFLARKLGVTSRTGEVLDPIADKIFAGSAFLTLTLHHHIEAWVAAIILGRDLTILTVAGAVLVSADTPRRFPPSIMGKASTAVQCAYGLSLMGTLGHAVPDVITEVFKGATVVLTIWSGIDYAKRVTLE